MTLHEVAEAVRESGSGPLQPSALFELAKDLSAASAARYRSDVVVGPAIASFTNQQDAYDWFAQHPERSRLTITADTHLGWAVRGYCKRDQVTDLNQRSQQAEQVSAPREAGVPLADL